MNTWGLVKEKLHLVGIHLTPRPMLTERCPGPGAPVIQIGGADIQVREGGMEAPGIPDSSHA